MSRPYYLLALVCGAVLLLLPDLVLAAGPKAEALIVVADTRRVSWPFTVWVLNTYNTDPFMLGVWCSVFTAGLGVTFGLTTDFLMKHTGIDLTHRTIVEH